MAKAVLISIRPEWAEKILFGKKTQEVRKTRPCLEMPFKCYIYYTKSAMIGLRGKPGYVVGEFECDKITWLTHIGFTGCPGINLVAMKDRYTVDNSFNLSDSCLTIGHPVSGHLHGILPPPCLRVGGVQCVQASRMQDLPCHRC